MATKKTVSKTKSGHVKLVQVSNKTKEQAISRVHTLEVALKLLRLASKSSIPTWAIADGENYKFEKNEIIRNTSD